MTFQKGLPSAAIFLEIDFQINELKSKCWRLTEKLVSIQYLSTNEHEIYDGGNTARGENRDLEMSGNSLRESIQFRSSFYFIVFGQHRKIKISELKK